MVNIKITNTNSFTYGTDLGSLIRNITMWKIQDFSAIQILRQINVDQDPKTTTLTIWAALNFWKLLIFSSVKFLKIQNWLPAKLSKRQFFWNQAKLISRKIIVAVTLLNFHSVEHSQSQNPNCAAQVCTWFNLNENRFIILV